MRLLLASVLFFLCTLPVVAQVGGGEKGGNGAVNGLVVDSLTRKPVEFANVALYDPLTGKPVNGTVCDEKGKFAIAHLGPGKYDVQVSFIGYDTRRLPIALTESRMVISLGTVYLSPSSKLLKEVVVSGQRQLVEEKVDRTVYNAEQDQTTKGGDATDVLKRVPLLTVDMDGNVSLRGSTSVKVLINGKPSTITANSVADALKQIPADMIKTVEVITSPSSKYDAEGSAGIINIILKRNTLEGKFLNTDLSMGSRGSSLSLSASYRKGKMGFSLGGFVRASYNSPGDFDNRQTTRNNGDTTLNIQRAHTRSLGNTEQFTAGWEYDINSLNSLTVSARYGLRAQQSYQDHLLTEKYPQTGSPSLLLQQVNSTNRGDNFDASMNYSRKFAQKDKAFNFMGIYSINRPFSGFVTDSLSQTDGTVLKSNKNENRGKTEEFTVQFDFQQPLGENQMLEFGAKDITRLVNSDYNYQKKVGSGEYQPSLNSALTNGFRYNQSITSGYISYTASTHNNYTFKGGARYEYTNIAAHFEGQPNISIPAYGVLVPSINVSRKFKNGNLLKASYNRRIQRPSLRDLNPNLQASNSLNATVGNPYLKPEYADNYEIAYKTFLKAVTFNFSTYVRYNTNDIQQARSIRHDTIVATFQNIGTEANYGASAFVTIPFSENFTVNGGADFFYRILKNNSNDPFINASNRGLVKNFRLFGNYTLGRGWSAQFFCFFQGRNINLQGYRTNPVSHSLAMKKEIFNKKGSIGLGVDNFATPVYKVHSVLNSAYLYQYSTSTLYNFVARATFSYRIGKISQEKKPKNPEGEEDANP